MRNTARVINLDLVKVVDQLGEVKAKIAHLKALEDALKNQLVESGAAEQDGTVFRATVSFSNRETIDWKAVAEKLEPSRQLIAAHTAYTPATTVRVTSRKS
jgi:hypothetical protein